MNPFRFLTEIFTGESTKRHAAESASSSRNSYANQSTARLHALVADIVAVLPRRDSALPQTLIKRLAESLAPVAQEAAQTATAFAQQARNMKEHEARTANEIKHHDYRKVETRWLDQTLFDVCHALESKSDCEISAEILAEMQACRPANYRPRTKMAPSAQQM